MTTQDRIQLIVEACRDDIALELLGNITARELTDWVTVELGNPEILDKFCSYGTLKSRAYAPTNILHVVSGNTPHAAFQTLLRGLLIGSNNIIKLPSSGLSELEEWINTMAPSLQELVTCNMELTPEDLQKADVIVAIGADETIAELHSKSKPHQKFIAHGHKVSIGIVTDDYENAARLAAKDCSLYNQRGCLSPHAIYVKQNPHGFAKMMAKEMEQYAHKNPPLPISLSEAGSIRNFRQTAQFIAANDPNTHIWQSPNSLDWTIILETDSTLKLSCLNRCIYIKPLPDNLSIKTLGAKSLHLSTIALYPFSEELATSLTHLPAHRFCPLGQSHIPHLFWHHDGFASLASLVTWKDIG